MDNRGNIVIYQTKDGKTSIDVKLENETVWLTQAQMADLFQKDRTVIGRHINNGEFYQFNLSSCIRQQNSLTAQFVSFSLSNLANIF